MSFNPPSDISSRPVAVIGAGTLGRRIAVMFATRGGTVRIYDPDPQALEEAVSYATEQLPAVVASIDGGSSGTVLGADDLSAAVEQAWLAVEAVPERLELKVAIFGELDRLTAPDAVLASNSSSYASRLLLADVRHPERVLNLHFYMPPDQRVADLMSSGHTDPAVMDMLKTELRRFGIMGFEARKESTGFIFNRVWAAIKREALEVVAEGVCEPAELDAMWCALLGVKVGPFEAMDLAGLDVILDIENHYADELPHLPAGPRELLRQYVEAGALGVKAGHGFYDYTTTSDLLGGVGSASGSAG